jgi:hypothetical protein
MVADELATKLAWENIPPGARVLDPFCGSGRLLAAATQASLRVGIDANPLAWLLTRAKLSNASVGGIASALDGIEKARRAIRRGSTYRRADRKVDWFAPKVERELDRIVTWINELHLPEEDRLVVAAALSATVREVSFARQAGWKLHRIDAVKRAAPGLCPWERLARRLRYCVRELQRSHPPLEPSFVELADARSVLSSSQSKVSTHGPYEVVFTSPPYGDSRSTVQYGAASALCMSVVSRINGLGHLAATGASIDGSCLGGRRRQAALDGPIKRFWAGKASSSAGRFVSAYLADYENACQAIASHITPGGKAIFIVGRRLTGGYRLRLDDFTVDRFESNGFELVARSERIIQNKKLPTRINRFARSSSPDIRSRGLVNTMGTEIVLVLEKVAAQKTPERVRG